MNERETLDPQTEQPESNKKGMLSIVVAGVLVIVLIVVVWSWLGGDDDDQDSLRQPAPVEVRDVEPVQAEPEPIAESEEEDDTADSMPDSATPEPTQIEQEPVVELPELDQSTPVLVDEAESRELNTRPLRSEHLVRDLVIFAHNLSSGDVIRESATIRGPEARFTTQTVDDQLYIDEASYTRYNEMVEWFRNLDSERLVSVYSDYEALFSQAFAEIAHPDERFIEQLLEGIDVLLATPEPEGLLALSDDQVMYTFADPELEALPAAQKQMLRLGLENQRQVKRKLREIRALLEESR